MKLTDDQRKQLVEELTGTTIGGGMYPSSVHRDEASDMVDYLAPIIESWLANPPEGWTERVQTQVQLPGPERWVAVDTDCEQPYIPQEAPTRTRRVWVGPWQEAQ